MWSFIRIITLVISALLMITGFVYAADEVRTEQVQFAQGASSATLTGDIAGYETVEYQIEARAGQMFSVLFRPSNASAYFNIFEPGKGPGDLALFRGAQEGNDYTGVLPDNGTYTVQVYLYRNAARRGERADYTLEIGIDSSSGSAPLQAPDPDYADGLSGGPDFWRVKGVAAGDALNLREGPSAEHPAIVAFDEGTILRNLGCRDSGGAKWCHVEAPDNPDLNGWVAGRYLVEASEIIRQEDALVSGTPYHATGALDCSFSSGASVTVCQFGVVRSRGASATVDITFPNDFKRTLIFENGKVHTPEGDKVTTSRKGDTTNVTVNGVEFFAIPDAVIEGG